MEVRNKKREALLRIGAIPVRDIPIALCGFHYFRALLHIFLIVSS
jgi:hypothetical protein